MTIRCDVRGMRYYRRENKLSDGDRIILVREPDNQHDKYAISLWTSDAENQPLEQIGHLPREIVPFLAAINDSQGLNVIATYCEGGMVNLEFPKEPA